MISHPNPSKARIFLKTFLCTVLLFSVLTIFVTYSFSTLFTDLSVKRAKEEMSRAEATVIKILERGSLEQTASFLQTYASTSETDITVFLKNARIKYSYRGIVEAPAMEFSQEAMDDSALMVREKEIEGKDGPVRLYLMKNMAPIHDAKQAMKELKPLILMTAAIASVLFAFISSYFLTNPVYQLLLELRHETDRRISLETNRSHFFRSAAHELKTPLARLRIMIESMHYGIGKYKDREKYFPVCEEIIDEMTLLVEQTLKNSAEIDPEEKNELRQLIENIAAKYRDFLLRRRLRLQISAPEKVIVAIGKNDFEMLFSNLLANAVNYSDEGGEITVSLLPETLSIENSCVPLSDEEAARVMQLFERGANTDTAIRGTGTGLYLSEQILKKYQAEYSFRGLAHSMLFTIRWKR